MGEHKFKEKCGLFGYYGLKNASERVYLGLHNNQHRGQESCGIVSWDKKNFKSHHGMGIINEVFNKEKINELNGYIAHGHVRYSTQGKPLIKNAQPFIEGNISIAHNGEIANSGPLRQKLKQRGIKFKTASDTEVFLKLLQLETGTIEERISKVIRIVRPSYSMIILCPGKLIGLRDPSGIKPLEIGKTKEGYALSSETVGFDIIQAEHIREVKPGEMVVFDKNGLTSYQLVIREKELRCIFELIYFKRPDSFITKEISVGMIRREFGKELYRQNRIKADVVIDVPDSSFDAAMGVSIESGIPYDRGLIRSHYIGRTFIEPSQELRDASVLKKFNVNVPIIKNKRVILVDDSIIRGTTLRNLIKFIRKKGAKEVHVMISSPPYLHGCYLGINTADESRLIAKHLTTEEIRKYIDATSLTYLDQRRMLSNSLLKGLGFCTYCFDGITQIPRD